MPVARKALLKRKASRKPAQEDDGLLSEEEVQEIIRKDRRSEERAKKKERIRLKRLKDDRFEEEFTRAITTGADLTESQALELQRRDKQNIFKRFGEEAIDDIAYVGEIYDRYTGAPMRAAIAELQEGRVLDSVDAFIEQFGEFAELAPTGQDIVQKMGLTKKDSLSEKVLGFGMEIIADPFSAVSAALKLGAPVANAFMKSAKTAANASEAVQKSKKTVTALAKSMGVSNEVIEFSLKKALETQAADGAFKAIASNSSQGSINSVLAKSNKTGATVGRSVINNGLIDYLDKPDKLLDKINGKVKYIVEPGISPEDPSRIVVLSKSDGSGKIAELSNQTTALIDQAVRNAEKSGVQPVDLNRMRLSFINKMREQMMKPGSTLDEDKLKAYENLFDNTVIKQNPVRYMDFPKEALDKFSKQELIEFQHYAQASGFKHFTPATKDLSQLQRIKQGIGRNITDKQFASVVDPAEATQKQMLRDVYDHINDIIKDGFKNVEYFPNNQKVNIGKVIGENNSYVSDLIDVGDMLSSKSAERYMKSQKAKKIAEFAIGGSLAGVLVAAGASPVTAMLVGGVGKVGGSAAMAAATKVPATVSRISEGAASLARQKGVRRVGDQLAVHSMAAQEAGKLADPESELSVLPSKLKRLRERRRIKEKFREGN